MPAILTAFFTARLYLQANHILFINPIIVTSCFLRFSGVCRASVCNSVPLYFLEYPDGGLVCVRCVVMYPASPFECQGLFYAHLHVRAFLERLVIKYKSALP